MAYFDKNVLILESGRQIQLTGQSLTILPTLELVDSSATIFLGLSPADEAAQRGDRLCNPHAIEQGELIEIAHFQIGLWIALVERIWENGHLSANIFNVTSA